MYFTPHLKENLEDFFNYKKEFSVLNRVAKEGKMAVVKGPRRVGKSSLLKVVYSLYEGPKAWLDGFSVRNEKHFWDLLELKLRELLLSSSIKQRLKDILSRVEIQGTSFKVNVQVDSILESEKVEGLLVIDEAQLLSYYGLARWLAHAYDHYSLRIFISGSQVGLLEKMLGRSKGGETPLKGRLIEEVALKPLDFTKTRIYLIEGCAQIGKNISESEIKEVYENVGGLIGWLTYYGYYRKFYDHSYSLQKVREKASEIVAEELENLLLATDRSYLAVLYAISKGFNHWGSIKRFLEIEFSLALSDSALKRRLDKLCDFSLIEKKERVYVLADPLLSEGLKLFF